MKTKSPLSLRISPTLLLNRYMNIMPRKRLFCDTRTLDKIDQIFRWNSVEGPPPPRSLGTEDAVGMQYFKLSIGSVYSRSVT